MGGLQRCRKRAHIGYLLNHDRDCASTGQHETTQHNSQIAGKMAAQPAGYAALCGICRTLCKHFDCNHVARRLLKKLAQTHPHRQARQITGRHAGHRAVGYV